MISKKLYSIIIILFQVHSAFQLNVLQQKIKDGLVTCTSNFSTDVKIQIAELVHSFLPKLLPQITLNMIGLTEVIVEFKSDCLSGHMDNNYDEEIKWGNIAANELKQQKTLDELNALMKSIDEDQQSSEISAARHLAIHLKNRARHIMESLTFHSDELLNEIAQVSVHTIDKETEALRQWFNQRSNSA